MQIVASEQQIQILLSGIFWIFFFLFWSIFHPRLAEPSDMEGQLYLILNKFWDKSYYCQF